MPKKLKKTNEEKFAEEYFPVDQTTLRYATEKVIKTLPGGEYLAKKPIEKEYKGHQSESFEEIKKKKTPKRKKISKKKYSKKKHIRNNNSKQNYVIPKIDLKEDGYELIITEKPQAASKIAAALGNPQQKLKNKVSYYELKRDNQKIVVACAVGHLFTLSQNIQGSYVPIFDVGWKPNYMVRKNDFTKRYYDTLLSLAKEASTLTVATDYDIEGELIGANVVRYLMGQDDSNRMKFSTLTKKELEEAYEKKFPSIKWGQAIAGESRHYLDWFYGINLSRALMNSLKTTGRFKIMSIGRVQGPALKLIVDREREILAFKPIPFWQVFITIKNSHVLELKYHKDIFNKEELDKFKNLEGKKAIAETNKTEQKIAPPVPFNLTTLQTEAYHLHGITPARTLRAAQSLYLSGLISYPRTSSQKLPVSLNYLPILKKLSREYNVENLTIKNKPIEGKKSDPAHPSIYPTGDTQILSGDEEKIYNLVVRRFLALFCEDAIIDRKKISVKINDLLFFTKGVAIRKKSWMEIYPSKLKENEIPDLDGEIKIIKSRIEEKETQPPKRYSPASLISELEKRNLGTKATRSSILDTLYERGYIKETSIEATPFGISLISTLEKYSPIIIDEELTREFEKEMENIQESKKEELVKKENILIEKAKKTITKIAKDFNKNEKKIGKELLDADLEQREQEKIENTICPCPVCEKGNLVIKYSKKFQRKFIACDAYPDCNKTYSLPPKGTIKKANKNCEKCNFPLLMTLRKGKKPWIFCFNTECETNKERLEEYKRKKEFEEDNTSVES